jgi:hydroxymethylglutaryl-CoA reductase
VIDKDFAVSLIDNHFCAVRDLLIDVESASARINAMTAYNNLLQALTVPAPEPAQDFPSIRDLFAMAVLTGELAAQSPEIGQYSERHHETLAKNSYKIADAMMKARQAVIP